MGHLELNQDQYFLTAEQLEAIVKLTVDECSFSWSWGEGIDLPVLGIRIDQLVLNSKEEDEPKAAD